MSGTVSSIDSQQRHDFIRKQLNALGFRKVEKTNDEAAHAQIDEGLKLRCDLRRRAEDRIVVVG